MAYTAPFIFTGNKLAVTSGQPTNQGNPSDANFGMRIANARAIGTEDQIFRLVWHTNTGSMPTATTFANGQVWRIDRYDPVQDNDGDPSTGNGGWVATPYTRMDPKNDLVSGMGGGRQSHRLPRPFKRHPPDP